MWTIILKTELLSVFNRKRTMVQMTLMLLFSIMPIYAAETPKEMLLEFENKRAVLSVEEYLSYVVPAHRNKIKQQIAIFKRYKGKPPVIKKENIKIVKESIKDDICEVEYQYTGTLPDGRLLTGPQIASTFFRKIDGKWYIDEYLTSQDVLRRNAEKTKELLKENPIPQKRPVR